MEMLKLCFIFAVIIAMIWWKKPMYISISAGILAAVLCYWIPIKDFVMILWGALTSWSTISMILSLYVITFLQRMLEKRNRLKEAQQSLDGIFNNRRINASLAPAVIGLLPSAAALYISGAMVKDACGDYMDNEDMTFVTSFFRHIPECFLPTYTNILLALTLTGVAAGTFVAAMIPMVIVLFVLGYVFMLRKIPKETGRAQNGSKNASVKQFFKSLWSIILIVALILIFNMPVYVATPIGVAINYFVDKFKPAEVAPMFISAFEPVLIINTILIMAFKDVLIYTGAINLLPEAFSALPVPAIVSFALIFFFGSIVSGSQAIVAMCLPMAMVAMPNGGLPMLVLLMCCTYAAMQISPTHICLFIATDYFHTNMSDLLKRTVPVIACFCAIAAAYTALLSFVF